MSPSDFARVLRAAAEECDRIAAEQRADLREWIDQASTSLGRRRHCAAVRRRVAAGDPSAAIVGRRHLLSATAHGDELGKLSRGERPRKVDADDVGDRLRRKLGIARVA